MKMTCLLKSLKRASGLAIVGIVATGLAACAASQGSSSSHAGEKPVVGCPRTTRYETAFCETAAEFALQQRIIHDPTIPDKGLIDMGITLTIGPQDHATVTRAEAEANAYPKPSQRSNIRSAVLGEMHNAEGLPAQGHLVWLLDVSPPGGAIVPGGAPQGLGVQPSSREPYAVLIVDAHTGHVLYSEAGW